MKKIKLYDELENESDEEYSYTSNTNKICYLNTLSICITMSLILYFIINSAYYYFELYYYQPQNIKIYNSNDYYVTWETNKQITCHLHYYYNYNSFVSDSTIKYNNGVFKYKASIVNIDYKNIYNFIVICKRENQQFKSQFFKSMLYP